MGLAFFSESERQPTLEMIPLETVLAGLLWEALWPCLSIPERGMTVASTDRTAT